MTDDKHDILDVDSGEKLETIRAQDPWVSAVSRWSSETWRFDGHIPGHLPYTISWTFEAPEGLIDKLKFLTACEFIRPEGRLADKKFTGTKNFRIGIRFLARFMAQKNLTEFSELTTERFGEFKRHLGATLKAPGIDPEALEIERDTSETEATELEQDIVNSAPDTQAAFQDAEHTADGEVDVTDYGSSLDDGDDVEIDGLTFSVARIRLEAWQYLVRQHDRVARAGVQPIGFDPFKTLSVNKLAHKLSSIALKQVEAIPDDVVNPILREAYRLLGQPAEDVIRVQRKFLEIRGSHSTVSHAGMLQRLREYMGKVRFKFAEGENVRWRGPFDLTDVRATGAEELTDLVELIRNAAMIVLLAGVGWRISEACSPEIEERTSFGPLPSCLYVTPSLTGTSEHFWIKGKISKMRREADPEQWLLGARLRGTTVEPPTVRAVRVLERLLQPWRQLATDPFTKKQLLVRFRDNKAMPTKGEDIVPILYDVVRRATRKFIVNRCGVKAATAKLVDSMPRLKDYHVSEGANIRLHQWRHTYYQMLIRIDPELQPALSDHFKHTDMAMTENAYGAKRRDIEDARLKAMLENSVDFFARQRGKVGTPKAHIDKAMRAGREALEKALADFGLEEEDEAIKALCISHDLRVYPAKHGRCLVALNPDEAQCQKREGGSDWRVDTPNFATRSPSLCPGCMNFSIGQENVPYWRRRYLEYRTAWVSSGRHPSFRFALQRSIQAAAVLRSLDQPVPVILAKERRLEKQA
jgi:integrase